MALQFSDNGLETSTLRELFQELSDGYKGIYGQDIDLDRGNLPTVNAWQSKLRLGQILKPRCNGFIPKWTPILILVICSRLSPNFTGFSFAPAPGLSVTLKSQQTGRCFSIAGTRYGTRANQVWAIRQDVTVPAGVTTATFFCSKLWESYWACE